MNNKKKASILGIATVSLAAIYSLINTEDSSKPVLMPNTVSTALAAENRPAVISSVKDAQTTQKQALESSNADQAEYLMVSAEDSPAIPSPESMNPIDRIRAIQNKTELHEAILKDHDDFTRYPEYNARFELPEYDPTIKRYELDERTTENKEDHTALTIWSDKKYYLHNDRVTVFASLRDQNGRVIPTQFIGQLIYDEQVGLQDLQFMDADLDGIHEVSFKLSANDDTAPLQPGVYKVLIVNKHNQIADAVSFTLSQPDMQLSGNYRDKLLEGSLLIEAEVKVKAKNRYYFQASLYSETGTPIGSSQYTSELEAGSHWVPLSFDGLMIRDSEESGPYTLKNISFAKVALPIQRAPLQSPDYLTQSYELDQFKVTRYAGK